MIELVKQILFLLGKSSKQVIFLSFLFFIVSASDIASIALIGTFIGVLFDPGEYLPNIYEQLSIIGIHIKYVKNDGSGLLYLGILLVIIFLIKFLLVMYSNYAIFKFSNKQQEKIQKWMGDYITNQEYESFISNKGGDNLASFASFAMTYKDVLKSILQILSSCILIVVITIFLGTVSLN